MIYNEIDYENFVKDLLKKSQIFKTKQLYAFLRKTFITNDEIIKVVLLNLQRQGYLFMSRDGWTLTKGLYQTLLDDRLFDKIDKDSGSEFKINYDIDDICKKYKKEYVASLWVIANFMPKSEHFVEANDPFTYTAITEGNKKNTLLEVCYFPHNIAELKGELLRVIPCPSSEGIKDSIRRIAILESPEDAVYVPHLGFTYLIIINENKREGFEIIEHRTEDVWL